MKNFITDKFIADTKNRELLINKLITSEIDNNIKAHISVEVFAKSVCKRNIHRIKIGNVSNSPTLYVGTFHGMEWLTGLLLIKFVQKLIYCLKRNKKLRGVDIASFLNKQGLIIIPCLNPDGVEISLHGAESAVKYSKLVKKVCNGNYKSWQANARGVDLNHNFPAMWQELHKLERAHGIKSPSPTRYGGPRPLSEPETLRLVSLCTQYNFRQVFAFHSQGEEIYWSFGDKAPTKSKLMANVLAASSGYTISKPEGLAIGGGFKDWFISKYTKPGFTIEIGKGKNPLPISELEPIYAKIEEMLLLGFIL